MVRYDAIRALPDQEYEHREYPAWTGIQSLPGYNYQPAPSDGIANGVYQDFANFVRTFPYSWNSVRASRVNNVDGGIYKNFKLRERFRLQYRLECYNLFNHPRFPAPDTNPASSTSAKSRRRSRIRRGWCRCP